MTDLERARAEGELAGLRHALGIAVKVGKIGMAPRLHLIEVRDRLREAIAALRAAIHH